MADGDLILRFGLQEERHANAVNAAESLLAWVAVLKEAARAIDPKDEITVELLGAEPGSLKFPQILKYAEGSLRDIAEGASEYPYLKKAAVGLAIASATAISQTGLEAMIQPDVQVVALSTPDRQLFEDMRNRISASGAVQSASRRFFQTVERDPAVTEVTVAERAGGGLILSIPRSEFPVRGGLWTPEEAPPAERPMRDIWDVVLLRAPFVHVPRNWSFSRDGLPFSARMEDPPFLAAIRDGTIPITLQEGVTMRIEVEFKERLIGQVWTYVDGTRKVVKVLSPLPLAAPPPVTYAPKKD